MKRLIFVWLSALGAFAPCALAQFINPTPGVSTPTSITNAGGSFSVDGSGVPTITPASGQGTTINGTGAYFAAPVVLPTISSPVVSSSTQAKFNYDGANTTLSQGGGAFVPILTSASAASTYAPLASPTFTGSVATPALNITAATNPALNYGGSLYLTRTASGTVSVGTTQGGTDGTVNAANANFTGTLAVSNGTATTLTVGNQTANATTAAVSFLGKSAGGTGLAATWNVKTSGYFSLDAGALTDAIRVDVSTGAVAFTRGVEGQGLWNGSLNVGTYANADENAGLLTANKAFASGTGNHHVIRALSQDAVLAAAAGVCSFDGDITVSSANNIDHMVDFQARSTHSGTGTVTNMYGGFVQLTQSGGTVTTLTDWDINDYTGSGTVTTHYGVRVHALTKAGANYAFYSDGTTPSSFGGQVTVGSLNSSGSVIGSYFRNASNTGFHLYGEAGNYAHFYNPAESGDANLKAATYVSTGLSAAPSSPLAGTIYYNTTDGHFYGYSGGASAWKQMDN